LLERFALCRSRGSLFAVSGVCACLGVRQDLFSLWDRFSTCPDRLKTYPTGTLSPADRLTSASIYHLSHLSSWSAVLGAPKALAIGLAPKAGDAVTSPVQARFGIALAQPNRSLAG